MVQLEVTKRTQAIGDEAKLQAYSDRIILWDMIDSCIHLLRKGTGSQWVYMLCLFVKKKRKKVKKGLGLHECFPVKITLSNPDLVL